MRKRFLAAMLSCTMIFSLAGCGKTAETNVTPSDDVQVSEEVSATSDAGGEVREADLTDIIPKETVTLNVYDSLANYSGEQVGWFGKLLLDKFNVKLNIIPDPEDSGVFETRMESGDLGDICIFGGNMDKYNQAVTQGKLWDWDEEDLLVNYGPYINAHMQKALEKNKEISGGTLYGFAHNVGTNPDEITRFDYHPDLRYDVYQQAGSPKITTLEDYVDVLDKMVKACPKSESGKQTYGVSLFPDWDGDMVMFVKATAALYGYDEFGFGLYDVNTQTYEDALRDNSMYLRCLKFYNTLYQRGLLNPDSSTQTFDNVRDDYLDGSVMFNLFAWLGCDTFNTPDHLAQGKAFMPVPCDDQKPIIYGCNVFGDNYIWTIGANTEYPELCMAIINWLATPEGNMESTYGPKDVCWYYDENGKICFTELGKQCNKDHETEMSDGYSGTFKNGMNNLNNTTWSLDAENPDSNGETYNDEKWESELNYPVSEIQQQWRDNVGYPNPNEYLASRPYSLAVGTKYVPSVKPDELNVKWNQVAKCIREYSWKAIYAKDDATYDKIVAEMKEKADGYGYAECVEFQNHEAELRKACEDEVK